MCSRSMFPMNIFFLDMLTLKVRADSLHTFFGNMLTN